MMNYIHYIPQISHYNLSFPYNVIFLLCFIVFLLYFDIIHCRITYAVTFTKTLS